MSEVDKAALDNNATWKEQTEPGSIVVTPNPNPFPQGGKKPFGGKRRVYL